MTNTKKTYKFRKYDRLKERTILLSDSDFEEIKKHIPEDTSFAKFIRSLIKKKLQYYRRKSQ
jgi:predicted CopG family antitoxin